PWALNKQGDSVAVAEVLGDCLEVLRLVALWTQPLIPNASNELWRRLGLDGAPDEQRLPRRGAMGTASGRVEARQGRAAVPAQGNRIARWRVRRRGSTRTATCRATTRTTRSRVHTRLASNGWSASAPISRRRVTRSTSPAVIRPC